MMLIKERARKPTIQNQVLRYVETADRVGGMLDQQGPFVVAHAGEYHIIIPGRELMDLVRACMTREELLRLVDEKQQSRPALDYVCIRAWGVLLNQTQQYVDNQVRVAHKTLAPTGALYRDVNAVWQTVDDVNDPALARRIEEVAAQLVRQDQRDHKLC